MQPQATRSSFNQIYRFGQFELDVDASELTRAGRPVRLQPQPFKLLVLVIRNAGRLVTREEIKAALWSDGTYVDFDQAVNFAVRQIRDALGDAADSPLYIQTVPKRGYRFIAPVDPGGSAKPSSEGPSATGQTVRLQKALWANIAEIRMAQRRQTRLIVTAAVAAVLLVALLTYFIATR
jgi:DNA-binding winged helix-turn-helix (wHTH) protein